MRREWPKRQKVRDLIIGLDGEGKGRRPHRYTYLAAVDEHHEIRGEVSEVRQEGLRTRDCLDLILSLPKQALLVGYAFTYDLTKMLQDLPDESLYLLFHEEKRAYAAGERIQYRPVEWEEYKLNFMNRKFTVERDGQSRVVWDVFRFYAGKFTQALLDWKVGDADRVKWIAEMKDQRSAFDKLDDHRIQLYCRNECAFLAQLMRKLIHAHEAAGLELKTFFGAGSTASAFLEKIGVKDYMGEVPAKMRDAVAAAFFGGRFENSVVGPVRRKIYSYDISSAYPYQTCFLPCLKCGKWTHQKKAGYHAKKLTDASLALVRWYLPRRRGKVRGWGPLPVRTAVGSIVFPAAARGGWCWRDEFVAAKKLCPHLQVEEVWYYRTKCKHRPFKDVPSYYLERLRLGKEGPGIVIKLGMNSIYGKLAQSKGATPPYQQWVWAGNITSGTRAQLLGAIAMVKNPWDVLMFATDSVSSRIPLKMSAPRETGTGVEIAGKVKPLGGWEPKEYPRGVMAVRPGIYFPLRPGEDELKEVRARGLGKKVLYEQWKKIMVHWRRHGTKKALRIQNVQRFVGAKSGVTVGAKGVVRRSKDYGEWVDHPIEVSFDPAPKRSGIAAGGKLKLWPWFPDPSCAYEAALKSPEGAALKAAETIAEEQPDIDFSTWVCAW